ncbi:MAG: hypothetical protein L6R41_000092 [Letrouitia leprolyta]|nr:MAG: hypothetical protein L6R41_000092 [Letrouitia leprolyta]
MMGEPRRSSRRLSARLGDKEDVPIVNGTAHTTEKKDKSGQGSASNTKQAKTGVNGATSNSTGSKTKRKLDDEDSDGFKFTRTRAKKAKAEPPPQIPPIAEDKHEESPPKLVAAKKTRKRTSGSPAAPALENGEKPERRRRSARNSGDKDLVQDEPPLPPLEVKKKRKPKEDGSQEAPKSKKQDLATSTQPPESAPSEPSRTQAVDKPLDPIKVSLPFADTPIIRRNKEMRRGAENGSRRSSLGMRGRRASSLIDSGKSDALPHEEVESSEFYKHIESSLTEPRRMKQLLTWCGTRALGEKPISTQPDFQARQAAREIQQQLLKDFSTKSEMSDWFNRKDTTPPPQPPKPNPKNVSNGNKIKDLEQQLARLQTERQTWETLLRPPSESLSLSPTTANPDPHSISSELLASPTQISTLSVLQSYVPATSSTTSTDSKKPKSSSSSSSPKDSSLPTTNDLQSSTSSRLRTITSNLEFSIDMFATNVHALNAYKTTADRVAGEVLAISAEALEERDVVGRRRRKDGDGHEVEGEEVGMRDVLRGLSRVVDR